MRKYYYTLLIVSFIAEIVFLILGMIAGDEGSIWTVVILSGIVFGLLLYFLPFAIAKNRKVDNTQAVFLVNLLAGWCFVGWVAALIMAVVMKTELDAQIEREVYASVRNRSV